MTALQPGPIAGMPTGDLALTAATYLLGYAPLLATSSRVVGYFPERWTGTDLTASVDAGQRDTGRVIQ